MSTQDNLQSLIDELARRIEKLPAQVDNEAWRREFLINPILTSPFALGFLPSEIGAEISYPVSDIEFERIFKQFGLTKKRIRPDYVIIPADQQMVAAVVEAKERHSSLESHLRHSTQVVVEQFISHAPWGILTDGERWTVFRGDESILHLDSLEDIRRGMADLRQLIGSQSIRHQLIHKPTLTMILLSSSKQEPTRDSDVFEGLHGIFPDLSRADFRIIAPASVEYNSFAAAAGDRKRWWEPDQFGMYYWPSKVMRAHSQRAFIEAYTAIGYEECVHSAREIGLEKIAFYGEPGSGPRHAAYQLSNGLWVSKLGRMEEIAHPLKTIEGDAFGQAILFMQRSTKQNIT
jgi:hypothetical protein